MTYKDCYAAVFERSIRPRSPQLLRGPPPPSYITYFYSSNPRKSITLMESRTTIEAGTTGLRTWDASFLLADWLLENSSKYALSFASIAV